MASRAFLIAVFFVLGCLAVANAQCIKCSDCNGNSGCLSMCKKECQVTVNVEDCKRYGVQAGKDAATEGCDLAKSYCDVGIMPRSYMPPPYVTLEQCGNAAYGVCQNTARDKNYSPCAYMFNGAGKCTKESFWEFYGKVTDASCNQKSAVFDKPQGRKLALF
jgi:hypothetical protein